MKSLQNKKVCNIFYENSLVKMQSNEKIIRKACRIEPKVLNVKPYSHGWVSCDDKNFAPKMNREFVISHSFIH